LGVVKARQNLKADWLAIGDAYDWLVERLDPGIGERRVQLTIG